MTRSEMSADDIDADFVPRRRRDVAFTELEGEIVVAVPLDAEAFNNFDAHWLDGNAAAIWKGLDGQRSIATVADLISTAYDADPTSVFDEVLAMARVFGRAGVFEGIAPERPDVPDPLTPEGLPIGAELPVFELADRDGVLHRSIDIWRGRTLLVHWSPTCGYCITLARVLAELMPALRATGAEVVLLTNDMGDHTTGVLADVGLDVVVLRNEGYLPFDDLGTPSGYLVDAAGRVAERLAVGADQLADVARLLAGMADSDR